MSKPEPKQIASNELPLPSEGKILHALLCTLLLAAGKGMAGLPRYTLGKVADVYGLSIDEQALGLTDDGIMAFTSSNYGMVIHTGSGPGQAIPAPAGYSEVSPGGTSVTQSGRFVGTGFDGRAPAIPAYSTTNVPVRYTPGVGYEN